MRKKITRLLGLGLSVTMLLPTVAFSSENGEFDPRSITEGQVITIAAKNHAKIEDYNTNKTTLAIEEALGVDLQFQVYASEDYQDKLNAMVASGEKLPDILFDCNVNNVVAWAAEDAVIDLAEWFANEDYAANFLEACDVATSDVFGQIKNADGKMYYFPNYIESVTGQHFAQMRIYQPYLDKLGVELPRTTDEFYELAKLVAENDLNGNGKADEYILGGSKLGENIDKWFEFLMSPFVYAHDANYLVSENGELSFAYMSDEWKEGLKYIKRFFDAGYIPLENLTQNWDDYNATRIDQEVKSVSFVWWPMETPDTAFDLLWSAVPALEGPDGTCQSYYKPSTPNAAAGAVITADCENPLAAFLVCDLLCSEELSITCRYGERGVDWDYFADMDVDVSEYDAAYEFMGDYGMYVKKYDDATFWGGSQVQNVSYLQAGPLMLTARCIFGNPVEKEPTEEKSILQKKRYDLYNEAYTNAAAVKPEEVVYYLPMTSEEQYSIVDPSTEITKYLYESVGAFLTGAKDIDAEWDNYINELKTLGVEELLATYQTAWDRVVG